MISKKDATVHPPPQCTQCASTSEIHDTCGFPWETSRENFRTRGQYARHTKRIGFTLCTCQKVEENTSAVNVKHPQVDDTQHHQQRKTFVNRTKRKSRKRSSTLVVNHDTSEKPHLAIEIIDHPSKDMSQEDFLQTLGLVTQSDALHLTEEIKNHSVVDLDCQILYMEEPMTNAKVPTSQTCSIMSHIKHDTASTKRTLNLSLDSESSDDSEDVEDRYKIGIRNKPVPRRITPCSLLAIDLFSPLGQRVIKSMKGDLMKLPVVDIEQYCTGMPEENKMASRLRKRHCDFDRLNWAKVSDHCHTYKFNSAQRRKCMVKSSSGLNKKSRCLLQQMKKCVISLTRLSESEIYHWTVRNKTLINQELTIDDDISITRMDVPEQLFERMQKMPVVPDHQLSGSRPHKTNEQVRCGAERSGVQCRTSKTGIRKSLPKHQRPCPKSRRKHALPETDPNEDVIIECVSFSSGHNQETQGVCQGQQLSEKQIEGNEIRAAFMVGSISSADSSVTNEHVNNRKMDSNTPLMEINPVYVPCHQDLVRMQNSTQAQSFPIVQTVPVVQKTHFIMSTSSMHSPVVSTPAVSQTFPDFPNTQRAMQNAADVHTAPVFQNVSDLGNTSVLQNIPNSQGGMVMSTNSAYVVNNSSIQRAPTAECTPDVPAAASVRHVSGILPAHWAGHVPAAQPTSVMGQTYNVQPVMAGHFPVQPSVTGHTPAVPVIRDSTTRSPQAVEQVAASHSAVAGHTADTQLSQVGCNAVMPAVVGQAQGVQSVVTGQIPGVQPPLTECTPVPAMIGQTLSVRPVVVGYISNVQSAPVVGHTPSTQPVPVVGHIHAIQPTPAAGQTLGTGLPHTPMPGDIAGVHPPPLATHNLALHPTSGVVCTSAKQHVPLVGQIQTGPGVISTSGSSAMPHLPLVGHTQPAPGVVCTSAIQHVPLIGQTHTGPGVVCTSPMLHGPVMQHAPAVQPALVLGHTSGVQPASVGGHVSAVQPHAVAGHSPGAPLASDGGHVTGLQAPPGQGIAVQPAALVGDVQQAAVLTPTSALQPVSVVGHTPVVQSALVRHSPVQPVPVIGQAAGVQSAPVVTPPVQPVPVIGQAPGVQSAPVVTPPVQPVPVIGQAPGAHLAPVVTPPVQPVPVIGQAPGAHLAPVVTPPVQPVPVMGQAPDAHLAPVVTPPVQPASVIGQAAGTQPANIMTSAVQPAPMVGQTSGVQSAPVVRYNPVVQPATVMEQVAAVQLTSVMGQTPSVLPATVAGHVHGVQPIMVGSIPSIQSPPLVGHALNLQPAREQAAVMQRTAESQSNDMNTRNSQDSHNILEQNTSIVYCSAGVQVTPQIQNTAHFHNVSTAVTVQNVSGKPNVSNSHNVASAQTSCVTSGISTSCSCAVPDTLQAFPKPNLPPVQNMTDMKTVPQLQNTYNAQNTVSMHSMPQSQIATNAQNLSNSVQNILKLLNTPPLQNTASLQTSCENISQAQNTSIVQSLPQLQNPALVSSTSSKQNIAQQQMSTSVQTVLQNTNSAVNSSQQAVPQLQNTCTQNSVNMQAVSQLQNTNHSQSSASIQNIPLAQNAASARMQTMSVLHTASHVQSTTGMQTSTHLQTPTSQSLANNAPVTQTQTMFTNQERTEHFQTSDSASGTVRDEDSPAEIQKKLSVFNLTPKHPQASSTVQQGGPNQRNLPKVTGTDSNGIPELRIDAVYGAADLQNTDLAASLGLEQPQTAQTHTQEPTNLQRFQNFGNRLPSRGQQVQLPHPTLQRVRDLVSRPPLQYQPRSQLPHTTAQRVQNLGNRQPYQGQPQPRLSTPRNPSRLTGPRQYHNFYNRLQGQHVNYRQNTSHSISVQCNSIQPGDYRSNKSTVTPASRHSRANPTFSNLSGKRSARQVVDDDDCVEVICLDDD